MCNFLSFLPIIFGQNKYPYVTTNYNTLIHTMSFRRKAWGISGELVSLESLSNLLSKINVIDVDICGNPLNKVYQFRPLCG